MRTRCSAGYMGGSGPLDATPGCRRFALDGRLRGVVCERPPDVTDRADRRQPLPDDAALRAIVEGVEAEIGDEFFASLVRQLASALDVQYAFVSEIASDRCTFRTLALWARGALRDNLTVPLA